MTLRDQLLLTEHALATAAAAAANVTKAKPEVVVEEDPVVPRAVFERYVTVQRAGRFNMWEAARRGIVSQEQMMYIMEHYEELDELYNPKPPPTEEEKNAVDLAEAKRDVKNLLSRIRGYRQDPRGKMEQKAKSAIQFLTTYLDRDSLPPFWIKQIANGPMYVGDDFGPFERRIDKGDTYYLNRLYHRDEYKRLPNRQKTIYRPVKTALVEAENLRESITKTEQLRQQYVELRHNNVNADEQQIRDLHKLLIDSLVRSKELQKLFYKKLVYIDEHNNFWTEHVATTNYEKKYPIKKWDPVFPIQDYLGNPEGIYGAHQFNHYDPNLQKAIDFRFEDLKAKYWHHKAWKHGHSFLYTDFNADLHGALKTNKKLKQLHQDLRQAKLRLAEVNYRPGNPGFLQAAESFGDLGAQQQAVKRQRRA